jgi:hypothetical protein
MSRTENPHLTQILDSQEDFAPDVDAVYEGITHGIRNRRHPRIGYVATAVVALALIAGSLAVIRLPDLRSEGDTAAGDRSLRTDTFRRTIQVGWMPAELNSAETVDVNDTTELFARTSVANNGLYADLQLMIEIYTVSWQPPASRPEWESITINGRPGWLASAPSITYIDWQVPSGRWARLRLASGFPAGAPGPYTQPRLETDARRVAESVTEGPSRPVRVGMTLTYLPANLIITGVRDSPSGCGSIQVSTGKARIVGTGRGRNADGVEIYFPEFAPRERFGISCGDLAQTLNLFPDLQDSNEVVDGRDVYRATRAKSVVVGGLPGGLAVFVQGPPIDIGRSPAAGGPDRDEIVKVALGVRVTP